MFGSNLAGRHGKGAALTALAKYGAQLGNGRGLQGRSYAIPTKNKQLGILPLQAIEGYVKEFLEFAHNNPNTKFFVTAVGTGLAGFGHSVIAPMFSNAPGNCRLPPQWVEYNKRIPE